MHSELMDEKERRVELFRKLMEREQIVAELRMYVKLLEEKLEPKKAAAEPERITVPRPSAPVYVAQNIVQPPAARAHAPSMHARAPDVAPPLPPRVARPKIDGWKTW